MKEQLIKIINEFGDSLTTAEYNSYVFKLRDYLVPYILEKKGTEFNIEQIFKDEFTRRDIINATVYYVENNENVRSVSAVDDYLIALNRLFDELLLEKYPNPNLTSLKPFTSLAEEVLNKLKNDGIYLKEKETYPPIDENQLEFILKYLKNYKLCSPKTLQAKIIIKLMLLYGFSHDKIAHMVIDDFNVERRTLKVRYMGSSKRDIHIELPYSLAIEINQYLTERSKKNKLNSELLFVTEGNNEIKNGYVKDILDLIRDEYYKANTLISNKNQFTPTSIQKYAIIQMIMEGMNQSIIMDLTGQKEDIFGDCQDEVNNIKEIKRDRYINQMVRGIATYDRV